MAVFDFFKDTTRANEDARRLEEIPIEDITPNPYQPRKTFDDESISELAQSIKQVGLIQPLVVRRTKVGFELVAGERRLRALKSLGKEKAPCLVLGEVMEEASAVMALIENLQRENLHFLEEAQCYSELLENYSMTQEELAERLGKSQSSVANKLRVLKLSPTVKAAMTEAGLSERHARALLRLSDESMQLEFVKQVKENGLSVKETERRIEKRLNELYDERKDGAKPRPIILRMIKDYRLFMNTINIAVNQLREAGMMIEVEQNDREDGVDINIKVTRPGAERTAAETLR